ncbi:MAG: putative Ig domain-containing protein [Nanoarchaeota archaeon]
MNKKIKIIMYLMFVVIPICYALPVPHGIDGYVYELDGVTKISHNVDFMVVDITSSEYIYGKTKNNGRYSVSLNGDNGDTIEITVWNKFNSNKRTVNLQGVMHNVDMLLNMTIPELPPNITSVPITEINVDEIYRYDVQATDENDDVLIYSLVEYPDGMIINSSSGMIEWTPNSTGMYGIIVIVNDSRFAVNQSYTLTVSNVPQIILGLDSPENRAPTDEGDSYDAGNSVVSQEISYNSGNVIIRDYSISGKKAEFIEYADKPSQIKSIDKKVYKYYELKGENAGSILLKFEVENKWLTDNDAEPDDLIVSKYTENGWLIIPSKQIDRKIDYTVLEMTADSGYYAISLNSLKEPNSYISTGPREQYAVSGIIYGQDGFQVKQGTKVRIVNRNTDEEAAGQTGFVNNSGGYYLIIAGSRQDIIDIIAESLTGYGNNEIELDGDMKNVNLFMQKKDIVKITGNAVSDYFTSGKSVSIAILIAILGLIVYFGIFLGKKRK